MGQDTYPSDLVASKCLFQLSVMTWLRAAKLFFLPILLATLCYFVFNAIDYFVKSPTQTYVISFFRHLMVIFFIFTTYCRLDALWGGNNASLFDAVRVCFSRFFPAFFVTLLIALFSFLLILLGVTLAKFMAPYTHIFGQLANAATLSAIGLLGLIWTTATFYAPFYLLKGGVSVRSAFKSSLATNSLSKTLFTYMPIIGLVILFLLTNQKMPWFHWTQQIWIYSLIQFVTRWLLGAWILNVICLSLNQSGYRLLAEDGSLRSKAKLKKEHRSKKREQRQSKKKA